MKMAVFTTSMPTWWTNEIWRDLRLLSPVRDTFDWLFFISSTASPSGNESTNSLTSDSAWKQVTFFVHQKFAQLRLFTISNSPESISQRKRLTIDLFINYFEILTICIFKPRINDKFKFQTFDAVGFEVFSERLEVLVERIIRTDGLYELIQCVSGIHLLSHNVYLVNEENHGHSLEPSGRQNKKPEDITIIRIFRGGYIVLVCVLWWSSLKKNVLYLEA